jgi:carbonic anhydrase
MHIFIKVYFNQEHLMSSFIDKLQERNGKFAADKFSKGLKMMPSMKTTIIGCVDPRVDPAEIFGLEVGEAAVIRNVGGRIFPSTLQTMGMLGVVAKANGGAIGSGWNLILLHHTDCGINCLAHEPMLAKHFDIAPEKLDDMSITDPVASVTRDIEALKANPQISAELVITGIVYDVDTGKTTVIVPPSKVREG